MNKVLNLMAFIGTALISSAKSLKALIPAWKELKESNRKDELINQLKEEVKNEN